MTCIFVKPFLEYPDSSLLEEKEKENTSIYFDSQ